MIQAYSILRYSGFDFENCFCNSLLHFTDLRPAISDENILNSYCCPMGIYLFGRNRLIKPDILSFREQAFATLLLHAAPLRSDGDKSSSAQNIPIR